MVWDEAGLIAERLNGLEVTRAVLTQGAIAACLSKDGAKEFNKVTKILRGE